MVVIQVHGRVVPANTTINVRHRLEFGDDPDFQPVKFYLEIIESEITLHCGLDSFDLAKDGSKLMIRAQEFVQGVVDVISFKTAIGLFVILDRLTDEHGVARMDYGASKLVNLVQSFTLDTYMLVYPTIVGTHGLLQAIRDLVSCIPQRHLTSVNCARAIETIRTLIAPKCDTRSEAWQIMRSQLNLSRDFLELIMEHSKSPRHGNHVPTRGENSIEIARRAWICMDRFLEYKKRSDTPLPIDQFPLL